MHGSQTQIRETVPQGVDIYSSRDVPLYYMSMQKYRFACVSCTDRPALGQSQ